MLNGDGWRTRSMFTQRRRKCASLNWRTGASPQNSHAEKERQMRGKLCVGKREGPFQASATPTFTLESSDSLPL